MAKHGGARPGAGRKPKVKQFPVVFAALDQRLADGVPDRLDSLEYLAAGGFEQIEEVYEPAGLIYRDDVTTGEDGKLQRTRVLAFPDLKATDLVCIRRTRSIAAPDRKANEYLLDRFAGRPTQAIEVDADPDGTMEITAAAMTAAAQELAEWRRTQSAMLSSLPSAPPTPPTSPTST